jgi:SAM-dependent methyltransferase
MLNYSDIILKYLNWAPISLAIREVSRIKALNLIDRKYNIFKTDSILDVGCGDGKWWTYFLSHKIKNIHGIDISDKEINLAKNYISSQCLDITSSEFLNKISIKKFDLIIGNCSIEHIYSLDKALKNIISVLENDGYFILMVPTPYWAFKGKSAEFLHRISPRLSMSFSGLINGFFQHWHLYNHHIWKSLLINFGFKVENIYGIGNRRSEFIFRLGLPTAFFSFIFKSLTGKYMNFFLFPFIPKYLQKKVGNILDKSLDEELLTPDAKDIFEYMIVCRK